MHAMRKLSLDFFRHALLRYRQETGQSFALWAFVALLACLTQIVFRREMVPGEFGTLNTVLGVIGLMTVPVLAVPQAFAGYLTRDHGPDQLERLNALRAVVLPVTETVAWVWGGISLVLLVLTLPLLGLPRFSLNLFTLLIVFLALGGVVSGAVCRGGNQLRLWAVLLAVSAIARLLLGAGFAWPEPWAESGLAAFFLAGMITLLPALRWGATETSKRAQAWHTVALDRDFRLYLGAAFSVLLASFLFSSADRIIAQSWIGHPSSDNLDMVKGYVDWPEFDAYQTAGLMGRSLLWGTQPLLVMLFAQRSGLNRTTAGSLTFLWIYLCALLLGSLLLTRFPEPLSRLFCGADFASTAGFIPSFAIAMVPLGLLQALGMFALASRRYHECLVLGGCAVGYALLLALVGRQAQLMPAYMFGGGLVALMIVLFVGVVRWGRKQP